MTMAESQIVLPDQVVQAIVEESVRIGNPIIWEEAEALAWTIPGMSSLVILPTPSTGGRETNSRFRFGDFCFDSDLSGVDLET